MGVCGNKEKLGNDIQSLGSLPSCFYFNRTKKTLFDVSKERILKYKFKGKLKSYPDSCAGMVENGKIIIIGGTSSRGAYTDRVFLIDPFEKTAVECAPILKPLKEGHLLEYKNYYYCVGGTIKSYSTDSITDEEGSPIMRYSKLDQSWEIVSHEEDSEGNIKKFRHHKHKHKNLENELQAENSRNLLRYLMSPGAFLFEDRIYFVGGKIYQDGQFRSTNKLFSFGLEEKFFNLREESFRLPAKLINPVCTAGSSNAMIAGGELENGQKNLDIFIIKFKENIIVQGFSKLFTPLEENYPPAYLEDEVVLFSFPTIWIRPKYFDRIVGFSFIRKNAGKRRQSAEILIQNIPEAIEEYKVSQKGKRRQSERISLQHLPEALEEYKNEKHKKHRHHKHKKGEKKIEHEYIINILENKEILESPCDDDDRDENEIHDNKSSSDSQGKRSDEGRAVKFAEVKEHKTKLKNHKN